ncbi:uncharacterized protein V1510DRAFT_409205 [Dipodascopsis tothii]|uniref:uncharacterized protein n=1 Tax=Dipodascopsis tothii TaxID=44089 RepID=UPI0034CD4E10
MEPARLTAAAPSQAEGALGYPILAASPSEVFATPHFARPLSPLSAHQLLFTPPTQTDPFFLSQPQELSYLRKIMDAQTLGLPKDFDAKFGRGYLPLTPETPQLGFENNGLPSLYLEAHTSPGLGQSPAADSPALGGSPVVNHSPEPAYGPALVSRQPTPVLEPVLDDYSQYANLSPEAYLSSPDLPELPNTAVDRTAELTSELSSDAFFDPSPLPSAAPAYYLVSDVPSPFDDAPRYAPGNAFTNDLEPQSDGQFIHTTAFRIENGDLDGEYYSSSDTALSPSFSPVDDTDFSSPDLKQAPTFASGADAKSAWSISWQPIITSDPVTNEPLVISSPSDMKDLRKSKLPPGTLDSYVSGPDDDGKYICTYQGCNKRFGRKYNIRTHIQTHLSDRPHCCTTCGSSFVRQHDLRRHAKIHEAEKPFTCPCGKSFARQDALSRHRLRKICSGSISKSSDD